MGGIIAAVLSTIRTVRNGVPVLDVKSDPGGGGNWTPEHFQPAGEDSAPLPGDRVGGVSSQGTGRGFVSGYADLVNAGIAEPGEVRRYARDTAGAPVCSVHLFRDGSIELASVPGVSGLTLAADGSVGGFNANGAFGLAANGDFVINGIVFGDHVHGTGSYTGDANPVSPGPLGGGVSGVPQ